MLFKLHFYNCTAIAITEFSRASVLQHCCYRMGASRCVFLVSLPVQVMYVCLGNAVFFFKTIQNKEYVSQLQQNIKLFSFSVKNELIEPRNCHALVSWDVLPPFNVYICEMLQHSFIAIDCLECSLCSCKCKTMKMLQWATTIIVMRSVYCCGLPVLLRRFLFI